MFSPFLNRIISTAVFYIGWIVCLQEAKIEHSYYGLFIIGAFITYFLMSSLHWKSNCLLMGSVLLIGPLSDLIYLRLGLLQYHSPQNGGGWILPIWVFALWGLFAANIHLFFWLKHRRVLSMILGGVGGAMSYLSVMKLGGVTALQPIPVALAAIGSAWGILFPTFLWLEEIIQTKFED